DLTAGGREHSRQHTHGGRLAGAVRAEEPDDLTGRDAERDAPHRFDRTEGLGQVDDADHEALSISRRSAGVSSSRPASTRTHPLKPPPGVSSPGTATARMPAASADCTPRAESSITTHSAGGRPSAAAAAR